MLPPWGKGPLSPGANCLGGLMHVSCSPWPAICRWHGCAAGPRWARLQGPAACASRLLMWGCFEGEGGQCYASSASCLHVPNTSMGWEPWDGSWHFDDLCCPSLSCLSLLAAPLQALRPQVVRNPTLCLSASLSAVWKLQAAGLRYRVG